MRKGDKGRWLFDDKPFPFSSEVVMSAQLEYTVSRSAGVAAALSNEEIAAALRARIGERKVLTKLIERNAKAGDASIYRLVPRMIVQPETVDEVQSVLEYCRENGLYLTFRAAGTSLSGQAVTDGILVDLASHWKGMRVLDGGERVAVEPGVIASNVNAFLAPLRVKIGPDPASINAAMIGGVVANNASGMCCGVQFNSYNTLDAVRFVLADGLELDTADPGADETLRRERPDLYAGLVQVRDELRADADLAERVKRKFAIKNTCGYSMNAFVDYERPIDILAHLLVGSEGTLGFLAEVTLRTLPDKPMKATALVYFEDLADAGRSVEPLEQAGAAVLEIMDRASMLSVAEEMQYPFVVGEFDQARDAVCRRDGVLDTVHSNCAALLIEFQEDSEELLAERLQAAEEILGQFALLSPVSFTRDPKLQANYWHMRKGLFPSVGAMRQMGTAVIIEDVCVEPRFLAESILDIQALFVKYHFPDAIIFGHARNGNVHFVICTDFGDPEQVARYAGLMDELTEVIVRKYDGSLKAEHGTGRNIAPFVEREWGEKLTALMWKVKHLVDPWNVLNPGVVLTHDPQSHLKNLKVMPAVSSIVDKCIECGFCEPRCPSRDLTVTPRQRIALLREVERLQSLGDAASRALADELLSEYEYYGKETCAADGMCATACPVKINTGDLVKTLRAAEHKPWSARGAGLVVRHFAAMTWGARAGLSVIHYGGAPAYKLGQAVMSVANRVSGGKIPRLPAEIPLPAPARKLPMSAKSGAEQKVVYFATCLTRSMGAIPGEPSQVSVPEAIVAIANKCGREVVWPKKLSGLCCGQPFFSKGFNEAGRDAASRTVDALWDASEQGRWPIICDTSPCTGQLLHCDAYLTGEHLARWKKLRVLDAPSWLVREVLPERADWPQLNRHVVLHPTCTVMKQGWTGELKKLAETFATSVELPVLAECCGFAGDRGLLFPELTLSATAPEAGEVRKKSGIDPLPTGDPCELKQPDCGSAGECDMRFYSTCRTCEMGMAATTGEAYASIVQLVYDALCAPGHRS